MNASLDPARVTLAFPAADPLVELRVDDIPIVTVVIPALRIERPDDYDDYWSDVPPDSFLVCSWQAPVDEGEHWRLHTAPLPCYAIAGEPPERLGGRSGTDSGAAYTHREGCERELVILPRITEAQYRELHARAGSRCPGWFKAWVNDSDEHGGFRVTPIDEAHYAAVVAYAFEQGLRFCTETRIHITYTPDSR